MYTTIPAPSASVLSTRPVWLVSALAGVTAAAATELYGLTAGDTAPSTKLMLALAHLIAAAIVIPVVTRRLAHTPRRP